MKGCICHCVKWQIHPFISKGRIELFICHNTKCQLQPDCIKSCNFKHLFPLDLKYFDLKMCIINHSPIYFLPPTNKSNCLQQKFQLWNYQLVVFILICLISSKPCQSARCHRCQFCRHHLFLLSLFLNICSMCIGLGKKKLSFFSFFNKILDGRQNPMSLPCSLSGFMD